MELVTTFAAARKRYRGSVGVVPTMGYLHEGHLSLVEAARRECDTVAVTLFVNPLQFAEGEDLERYPRDPEGDRTLAGHAGADILFAPPLEQMYPAEPVTRVIVRGLQDPMEGAWRPGHFEGVATVVTKLLAGLRPDRAYFGRKDAQQLAVVRKLVADLSFPVEVIGCPIIRELDGLALSSRNVYLSEDDRARAIGLSSGLRAAATAIEEGERDAAALEAEVAKTAAVYGLELEYAELVDAEDVSHLEALDRDAFLAVAARVGRARLIDNLHVWVTDEGTATPEFGIVLDRPSLLYERR